MKVLNSAKLSLLTLNGGCFVTILLSEIATKRLKKLPVCQPMFFFCVPNYQLLWVHFRNFMYLASGRWRDSVGHLTLCRLKKRRQRPKTDALKIPKAPKRTKGMHIHTGSKNPSRATNHPRILWLHTLPAYVAQCCQHLYKHLRNRMVRDGRFRNFC